jgi:acetate kinase
MPSTPLVGVFEPGFHNSAPLYAKVYGVPYEWFEKFGVRKYGYHGASHSYVTAKTIEILGLAADRHRIISCHLGGSSSVCAFQDGVAIDTSMGFTPQSGLIQGARTGDLDPFVLPYIMKKKGISLEQVLDECSKKAGLAGISGTSGDMRDIMAEIRAGSQRAELAREKFIYDTKRYIGEFLIMMEGIDAIAFTGGIGFHDSDLRLRVLSSLRFLGLKLDQQKNQANQEIITTADSPVAALAVETDEEIIVARETVRVIQERL